MSRFNIPLHPYHTPEQVKHMVDEMAPAAGPIVHPQQVIRSLRSNRPAIARANGWLADHIVGLAGTMAFFYFLAVLIGAWALWQSLVEHDKGFDAYPYSFLFFILGGIMQSLFVPTMLTASNRAAERDRIKDETDHRAWSHLYDVNDEQVRILRLLATRFLDAQESAATPPAS